MKKSSNFVAYLVRRLFGVILVMWLVATVVFILLRIIPGDPVQIMSGIEVVDPSVLTGLRVKLGLDQPIILQYLHWLGGLPRGDLGLSIRTSVPVSEYIIKTLPVTLELSILSFIIGVIVSLPAGAIAARFKGKFIDTLTTSSALVGISLPSFVFALIAIYIFAVKLHWLPSSGYVPFTENPIKNLRMMILPSLTLGLITAGILVRILRRSIIDQSKEDYVRAARARGAREKRVFFSHVLRNALIPYVTIAGIEIGILLSGSVITENIFAIPGMGRLIVTNIGYRDYPIVQGTVFVVAAVYVLTNFIVDLLYTVLDPRVKLE
jgi:peptide/nickel transport system permease protein